MLHIISVIRFDYQSNHTKSIIFIDGKFFSFGLEPEYKAANRVFGQRDLIPEGDYKVILSYSPKFKRILPEVLNVPFNSGIRIHPGNLPSDTSGCLLPGTYFLDNTLLYSSVKFNRLYDLINKWIVDKCEVKIDYSHLEIDDYSVVKYY